MTITAPLFDAERLTRVGRVTEVMPSLDGTWLAVTVARLADDESTYISDLWRVSLSDPEAPPIRLTSSSNNDTNPRFRPDGALAFLSDRPLDGEPTSDVGPRKQVWVFPVRGGEPEPLTDEPLGASDFRFASESGQLFLIADVFLGIPHEHQRAHAADLAKRGPTGRHYRQMPVRHWDHWLGAAAPHIISFGVDSFERSDLTPEADREHRPMRFGYEWDVSAGGRFVAISCARPGASRFPDGAVRVIDVDTGSMVDLGVVDNTDHHQVRFSPEGDAIACVRFTHDPGIAERGSLWLFEEFRDGEPGRPIAPDWDVWPDLAEWHPDGESLLCTAEYRGEVPVFRVGVDSGEVTRMSGEDAGGCHASVHFSDDGEYVVGLRHRLRHAPEPFRMEVTPGSKIKQLANLSGFLPLHGEAVAEWESFTVKAEDGTDIQCFIVLPRGRPGPHPALLWIHGGPMSQHCDGWHWRWNPLIPAAAGYAVILPNPRGSTGFGQQMIEEIWNNEWGGACYRDLLAVTDAVCARDDIDETRIGAMGGSFGGYMANWIGGQTDRFRCLMSHAGVFSMSGFSGSTDYPAFFHYKMACNPYQKPAEFDRYSPHKNVENWTTPTLIIHGEKDYRVPIGEALHLFDALDWKGVEVELLVFPDENHWILRPQNIRLWYRTVMEFADRHMTEA